jgi:glucose-1-phosphate thymidylyltransferase
LYTLINAGIKNILIVSGIEHAGDFLKLLGSGKEFGVRLTYEIQDDAKGIAHALLLAEDFVDTDKLVAILGDNVFQDNIKRHIIDFLKVDGARIFLKKTLEAKRFGVAEIKNNKVIGIEEKPKTPKSNYAVTGLYMYNNGVFEIIRNLKLSRRGEYEITDVGNEYVKRGQMSYAILKGFWSDVGTFDSLLRASEFIKMIDKKSKR